jgi:hypothetical protein
MLAESKAEESEAGGETNQAATDQPPHRRIA